MWLFLLVAPFTVCVGQRRTLAASPVSRAGQCQVPAFHAAFQFLRFGLTEADGALHPGHSLLLSRRLGRVFDLFAIFISVVVVFVVLVVLGSDLFGPRIDRLVRCTSHGVGFAVAGLFGGPAHVVHHRFRDTDTVPVGRVNDGLDTELPAHELVSMELYDCGLQHSMRTVMVTMGKVRVCVCVLSVGGCV